MITLENLSRSTWRLALTGMFLVSFILGGLTPTQAADGYSIIELASFADGSYPSGVVYGPDESFWFPLLETGEIGQVSGAGTTTHALPGATYFPLDITLGADLALWFSEKNADQIGQLTPTGSLSEYPLGEGVRSPTGIALGQDQAVWFSQFDANRIGRITTDGTISEFDLPQPDSYPLSITSAYDGSLWFTEWGSYRIGKISLQGEINEFTIPTPPSRPVDLLYGPDGNLWLTFNSGKTIARFNLLSETFDYFVLNTQSPSISDLTIGPDNHIWFIGTRSAGNFELVGGVPANLTEELLADPVYTYRGRSQIISGPDNDLVFTTANSSSIYQVSLAGAPSLRDLQMLVTYRPPIVLSSGEFFIDAPIVNWTNSDATDVQINLTLDENIHFVSADLPAGSCVDNQLTVQCSLPVLAAGTTLPIRFVLTTDRMWVPAVERTIVMEVSSLEGDYQPTNNRVVLPTWIQPGIAYFNDFSEGSDAYWSHQETSTPVEGLEVLGLFDNDQVIFNFGVLPPHDRAWLCFDLYILGHWDGNQYVDGEDAIIIGPDFWANYLDATRLLMTTYSNQETYSQAFPGNYPDTDNPFQTQAIRVGEFDGDPDVQDAAYHFCYRLEHTQLSLKMLFMGFNLDALEDEQWAIDNVDIKILYDAQLGRLYLPMISK